MLQILYLLVSDVKGLAYLRDNDIILFMANLVARVSGSYQSKPTFTHGKPQYLTNFYLKFKS